MLVSIDLTAATPMKGTEVRVGNVPNSVVISPDGKTAYVSNEAGRIAKESDFQQYSDGTPVVAAFPTGSTATGTVSVLDLASFTVTDTITTGLHPTGMAFWGNNLLVANTYSDTLSVINTGTKQVVETINLGLPIGIPGQSGSACGAGPNAIAVDATNNVAYVALYNANAIAVVNLNSGGSLTGMIPVGYAPSAVVLDTAGWDIARGERQGHRNNGLCRGVPTDEDGGELLRNFPWGNRLQHSPGPWYRQHCPHPHSQYAGDIDAAGVHEQSLGSGEEHLAASGGKKSAAPLAIPERIGALSKIKHVFGIIRENRTYDQIQGDVAGGDGAPNLAVFGDNPTFGPVTPNAHALMQRFPLFDNFYDPSRQSADGHNWIVQAMAPYSGERRVEQATAWEGENV